MNYTFGTKSTLKTSFWDILKVLYLGLILLFYLYTGDITSFTKKFSFYNLVYLSRNITCLINYSSTLQT